MARGGRQKRRAGLDRAEHLSLAVRAEDGAWVLATVR